MQLCDYQRLGYGLNFVALMNNTSCADEIIQQCAELQFVEERLEWKKEQQEWRSWEYDKHDEGILRKEEDAERREEDLAPREAIIKEIEIELGMIKERRLELEKEENEL